MSLFGGSSSSSSTTNLTQVDNTALGANAQDQGQAIILRGDNSKVEVLDAGAVNSAFGFAERNASAYEDVTRDIVAGYGGVVQAYGNTSENLAGQVINAVEGANQLVTRNIADLAASNASDLRSFAQYQSQNESGRLAQLVQWGILATVAIFAIQRFGKKAHA